ncbi:MULTISPECIES: baeRF2 domain-containing protein [Frankia]|nr:MULTISPECIES: Vms1/Ankzf1 family peptidyl-tRNA hydrolase [Frankia]
MDTSELRSLYDFDGPVVTVYASTDHARENAARLYDLRWTDILADLEGQGVGPATRDALLAERGDSHYRDSGTRVVVAVGEGGSAHVPFARWLPGRSDVDVVAVGPLPHLLPLLDWADGRIPHVIALVDRRGVDVLAYTDGPLPAGGVSQDTTRPPWHKAHTGGWAQRRYESRVEEHWKHGAKDDADRIVRAAHDIAAEVVILAGEPKELSLVREKLPVEVATRVVVVEGSRARDGSDDHLAGRVMDVLAEQRTRRTASLLAEFEQYRRRATSLVGAASGTVPRSLGSVSAAGVGHLEGSGVTDRSGGPRSGDRIALDAADGPRATVAALRLAQVSDLLLAEGIPAGAPAWIGPDLSEVALDPADLPAVAHPIRAGRVDALIRAALGTGAAVHSVPADVPESPTERVGALLRYTLSTPG